MLSKQYLLKKRKENYTHKNYLPSIWDNTQRLVFFLNDYDLIKPTKLITSLLITTRKSTRLGIFVFCSLLKPQLLEHYLAAVGIQEQFVE